MQFLRGVRDELRKVTWPSREDLFGDTKTVFSVIFIFAIFFLAVDSGLTWLLRFIIG